MEKMAPKGLLRIKHVQFFDRSVPIVLQSDNGPCSLIALCNILSLKRHLDIESGTSAVSSDDLLMLLANKLLDSNEDAEFPENGKQNIMDVLALLPQLVDGIDVNLSFRKIDGFELTMERAIFDHFGIKLYHGWIIDPQDTDLLIAIGSKYYNTLVRDLASFETKNAAGEVTRKGDKEEQEQLSKVLELSREYTHHSISTAELVDYESSESLNESQNTIPGVPTEFSEGPSDDEYQRPHKLKFNGLQVEGKTDDLCLDISDREMDTSLSKTADGSYSDQSDCDESVSGGFTKKTRANVTDNDAFDACDSLKEVPQRPLPLDTQCDTCDVSTSPDGSKPIQAASSNCSISKNDMNCSEWTSKERMNFWDLLIPKPYRDPKHESKVVLTEQDDCDQLLTTSTEKGELIRDFLTSTSHLTKYGLSCLKDGLKEHELCAFFRNNHFSTMFKFNGELYLLATDEGYAHEPDLVWEKLTEVNGNSTFIAGDFKEFKSRNQEDCGIGDAATMDSASRYCKALNTLRGIVLEDEPEDQSP